MFGLRDSAFENGDLEDVNSGVDDENVGRNERNGVEHIDDLVPEIGVDCSDGLADEGSGEAFFSIREVGNEAHDDVNRSDGYHRDPPETEEVFGLLHGLVNGNDDAHSFKGKDCGSKVKKVGTLVEGDGSGINPSRVVQTQP